MRALVAFWLSTQQFITSRLGLVEINVDRVALPLILNRWAALEAVREQVVSLPVGLMVGVWNTKAMVIELRAGI